MAGGTSLSLECSRVLAGDSRRAPLRQQDKCITRQAFRQPGPHPFGWIVGWIGRRPDVASRFVPFGRWFEYESCGGAMDENLQVAVGPGYLSMSALNET